MKPWLVRTHFGDLLNHVRQKLGDNELKQFPADVIRVAGVKPDDPVFPKGIMDYLMLPELAEVGGLVVPRSSMLMVSEPTNASASNLRCMPTTYADVKGLAKSMLEHKSQVDDRLKNRACGVHGLKDESLTRFSAKAWLQEMLQGRDIMADSDSPITQKSFSKLVWKSMGSWRMDPQGGDRVYLECRQPGDCLDKLRTKAELHKMGPVNQIVQVARTMQKFERDMAAAFA